MATGDSMSVLVLRSYELIHGRNIQHSACSDRHFFYIYMYISTTVKLVYKYCPRDKQNVVLIHRGSLCGGSTASKVYSWGPLKCGLYEQAVFIYRWSF